MTPLSIHEHQRLVGREAAQVGWPREGSSVTDGLGVDVEGGYDVAQHVREVDVALVDDLGGGDDVYRNGRLRNRARSGAGPDGRDPAEDDRLLGHCHIEKGLRASCDRNLLPRNGIPDALNLDQVSARGHAPDFEATIVVGQCSEGKGGDEDLGTRDTLVGGIVADGARDSAILCSHRGGQNHR